MDLNNKNIYIPLIAVSLSLIVIWIIFQAEFIKLLSEIGSFGTLIVAIYAVKEYRSKVVNKVNEEQLKKVLELLKKISKLELKITYCFRETIEGTSGIEITDDKKSLIDVSRNYKSKEPPPEISLAKLPNLRQKDCFDFQYNLIECSENFLNSFRQIYKYSNDPLIPKKIAEKIKPFEIDIETHKTIQIVTGARIRKNSLYRKMVRSQGIRWLVRPLDKYIKIENSEKDTNNKEDNFIIITTKDKNSPYYSWGNFRSYFNKLLKAIKDWFDDNNVKDVNLPDLN